MGWPFEPWSTAFQRAMVNFITGMDRQFKIVVEKHSDGYVAYPLGLKGIVVGEGDSYEAALADVKSAIQFHIQTFGNEVLPDDSPPDRRIHRRGHGLCLMAKFPSMLPRQE